MSLILPFRKTHDSCEFDGFGGQLDYLQMHFDDPGTVVWWWPQISSISIEVEGEPLLDPELERSLKSTESLVIDSLQNQLMDQGHTLNEARDATRVNI